MPRHGDEHTLPPHRINYRANSGRCGGGRQAHHRPVRRAARSSRSSRPGTFVICDQFVDRTQAPRGHVLRRPADHPRVRGRSLLRRPGRILAGARARSWRSRWSEGGTVVVIQGPRFSTRAESRWFAAGRLRRGQHDPVPGVLAGPRAGALLRERLARDRLRRRAGGHAGRPAGVGRRGVRGVPREPRQAARAACSGRCRGSGLSRRMPAPRRCRSAIVH